MQFTYLLHHGDPHPLFSLLLPVALWAGLVLPVADVACDVTPAGCAAALQDGAPRDLEADHAPVRNSLLFLVHSGGCTNTISVYPYSSEHPSGTFETT